MSTSVFIDGANAYRTTQALGWKIDFKKLMAYLKEEYKDISQFMYYTALDEGHPDIKELVDWLDYNGYSTVTKPSKRYEQSDGTVKIKGNMDIEMTVDIMRAANRCPHVVLFTGDGDFSYLLDELRRMNVQVTVLSTIKSRPPMIADELRRRANQFIDLCELRSKIERVFPVRKQAPVRSVLVENRLMRKRT